METLRIDVLKKSGYDGYVVDSGESSPFGRGNFL